MPSLNPPPVPPVDHRDINLELMTAFTVLLRVFLVLFYLKALVVGHCYRVSLSDSRWVIDMAVSGTCAISVATRSRTNGIRVRDGSSGTVPSITEIEDSVACTVPGYTTSIPCPIASLKPRSAPCRTTEDKCRHALGSPQPGRTIGSQCTADLKHPNPPRVYCTPFERVRTQALVAHDSSDPISSRLLRPFVVGLLRIDSVSMPWSSMSREIA